MTIAIQRRCSVLPIALLSATAAPAAVYTVGPVGTTGNCTHNTIQAALNAAAVNPGPDEIRITSNQVWTAQALTINNHTVSLTGGFADCLPLAPTGQTRLSGAGGAAAPVIAVTNPATGSQEVVLSRLEIVDGDAASAANGDGGGVRWNGPGTLRLDRVRVANNRGNFGGGIFMSDGALSLPLTLAIAGQVQIEDNQAVNGSGGGLYLNNADLTLNGADTTIRRNSARSGGGITAFADTRAQTIKLSTSGFGNDGLLAANSSVDFGGGLYVSGNLLVSVYSTDALRPTRLERNSARYGGAIHASNGARVELWESIVSGNSASVSGAALSLDGARAGAYRLPAAAAPSGAVACAAAFTCNLWQDNFARSAGGQPVNGAMARLYNQYNRTTELKLHSAVIRGNDGNNLFSDGCPAGNASCDLSLYLTGSEVVDNPAANFSAFFFNTGAYLDLCTVAGFGAGPQPLFAMNNGILSLSRSIVWQPGRTLLDMPTVLNASFLLLHDTSGFPVDPNIRNDDPRFVDSANGNYQLAADSPALDSAPVTDAPLQDLARASRVVDLPQITNLAGPLDLGSWEHALVDVIFANGFDPQPELAPRP